MGKYQAYPEYKDSGVEWLGDIPISWIALPIKMVSKIFNGATPKSGVAPFWDGDIPWVTPADLGKSVSPYISKGSRSITAAGYNSCGVSLVPKNSIILASRAPIGTLGIASNDLCTNQGCKSLVVKDRFVPEFLYYVLLSSTEQLNLLGRGSTFLELSADDLGSYKIPSPSECEQQKIASFLDHETAKIDTLIDKQQQLIQLLKEKRQAVISHAVTKGLNPNAPMRDSGVEWLGEVPEHWELWKLAHAYNDIGSGTTPPSGEEKWYEGDIPWITTGELRENVILKTRKNVSNETIAAFPALRKYPPGSIAIAMYGATIGRLGVFGVEATTNQACCVFTTSKVINNLYLFYWLQAYKDEIINLSSGGGQPNINQEKVSSLKLSAPDLDEQLEITNYLDKIIDEFERLELLAHKQINLLQERRTALISAAVTGKIDVRHWQAPTQNKEAV